MKRTVATILATLALAAVTMSPAAADGAPHHRPPATPLPLCVTTPWRAAFTGHPMTKPGTVCVLTDDMWKPRSWRVLVPWITVGSAGHTIEIVLARPTRTHSR